MNVYCSHVNNANSFGGKITQPELEKSGFKYKFIFQNPPHKPIICSHAHRHNIFLFNSVISFVEYKTCKYKMKCRQQIKKRMRFYLL